MPPYDLSCAGWWKRTKIASTPKPKRFSQTRTQEEMEVSVDVMTLYCISVLLCSNWCPCHV